MSDNNVKRFKEDENNTEILNDKSKDSENDVQTREESKDEKLHIDCSENVVIDNETGLDSKKHMNNDIKNNKSDNESDVNTKKHMNNDIKNDKKNDIKNDMKNKEIENETCSISKEDLKKNSSELINNNSSQENISQVLPKEDKKPIDTINSTVNIFQLDKPKTNQVKPSPFLLEKSEDKDEEDKKEQFIVSKEEEIDYVFKEKCCFYKFYKKWEKIGYGTVYITREKTKRMIFFREGTMSKLIDLFLSFDCKPYKKNKGVGFINLKEVDGKLINENVLLSFDSQLLIDKFYEIVCDK